jgi:hypothetical protein
LLKSIFNDFHVSDIHVHQALLLLVVVSPLLKSEFQESHWVGEFSLLNLDLLVPPGFSRLRLFKLTVVLFLQFVLEVFNFSLEVEFLGFVLRFQCQNLVVCFFRNPLTLVSRNIEFFGRFGGDDNILIECFIDPLLVSVLFPHNIDFSPESFVLRLQVVIFYKALFQLVLHEFDLVVVLSHFGGGGSDLLQIVFLFVQLFSGLLDLVFQDHETSKGR